MAKTPIDIDGLDIDMSKLINPDNIAKTKLGIRKPKEAKKVTSSEEKEARLLWMKERGLQELEVLKEAVSLFTEVIRNTVILSQISGCDGRFEENWLSLIDNLFIPVISGKCPFGLEQEAYESMRKEIFRLLASKYGINRPEELN